MKQEKRIAVVIMVGALVVLGWFLAKWLMGRKETSSEGVSGGGSSSSGGSSGGSSSSLYTSDAFPLRKGSGGARVSHLQKWLNYTKDGILPGQLAWSGTTVFPHSSVTVDGKFGANTEAVFHKATGYTSCNDSYYNLMRMGDY